MRILVVDDDASVVQALLATLKTFPGHEIRAALSGAKAIENAGTWGGIDLLISDVVMEPMDGFTLRDQLLQRYPALQTIFISGYDLSDYPAQTQNHQILTKPIDAAALVEAVNREAERAVAPPPPTAMPASTAHPNAVPAGQSRAAAVAPAARPAASVISSQPRVSPGGVPKVSAPAMPGARPEVGAPQARASTVPPPGGAPRAPVAQTAAPPVAAEESASGARVDAANNSAASDREAPAWQEESRGDPDAPEDELIGQTLGPYQITGRLSKGEIASAYTAVQVTINRPVVLKILDPLQQRHEPTRRRFVADARAKAHVQHPSIVSVYEAGEGAGRIIYAREYVDGQNLAEVQASGAKIDEATGLKVMRAVAEGLAYLRSNNIPHTSLEAANIYLASDGQPRLANLATQFREQPQAVEQEMQILARIMLSVLPAAQQLSPGLRTLLGRMVQAPTKGMNTWETLLQGLKALQPKVVPIEAATMLSAQDRAAIEAVDLARRQQRRSLWLNIASLTTLFAIVVGVVLWKFVFTNERKIQGEVLIPAGTYKIASGRTVEIKQPFSIDTYEVTFAQYGRFLTYLEEHPTADQDFREPRMPRHLTHTPENWNIYFLRAQAGKPVRSIPIDLNCPVIMVTWWDAYAYARWLGRELPTAEEWEVAATGGKEQKYPWGNEPEAARANSGADHLPNNPAAKGKVDGYNFWNPVDAVRGDKSPFGVVGMAGNVSEWTGSWTPERRPIIKGGSYRDPDVPLDKQIVDRDPSKGEEYIGFRTIKRNPTK